MYGDTRGQTATEETTASLGTRYERSKCAPEEVVRRSGTMDPALIWTVLEFVPAVDLKEEWRRTVAEALARR
jgi:hypothetical protein